MRRAILVAASEFTESESFAALRYPVRDAERLQKVLADPKLCFFDEVQLLANPAVGTARRALEKSARDSEPGDLLFFYYSGHGQLDRDGTLALAMPESERDYLRSTSLVSEELKQLFRISRASQKVMILDCCYGGAVSDDELKGSLADTITALAHQIVGSFVLTASTRFEPAFESGTLEGGALTGCLIKGIESGEAAPSESDHITLAQLASYVRQKVPEYGAQQPQCWDLGGVGDLVFSRRAVQFDQAWARRTRAMISRYCTQGLIDEDLGEDMRSAVSGRDQPGQRARAELVDRLLKKELGLAAFVREWDRTGADRPTPLASTPTPAPPAGTESAPVPPPRSPPSPPPPPPPADEPQDWLGSPDHDGDGEQSSGEAFDWNFTDEDKVRDEGNRMFHPAAVIALLAALAIALGVWLGGESSPSDLTAEERIGLDTAADMLDESPDSLVASNDAATDATNAALDSVGDVVENTAQDVGNAVD